MSSPYASPVASDLPVRGTWWVLRGAAALVAIAAWLVLLAHVLLFVRAEQRLDQVLEDANRFSQLPRMSRSELVGYTHRRLAEQGFRHGKVRVGVHLNASTGRPRQFWIEQIEAKSAHGLLRLTETATRWIAPPTRLRSGGPSESQAAFPFQ
ncbi:hypothetical protein NG895_08810 [Aeoliella sp. ICT_H6.2]|uniref:Uncharacterized protein n=1 Tax=Aeoliella straminimaris TaxID=2954799 RepID=A0A9X2JG48_9BACT|nr:hypothetical protein [Aeoliella straminimaris]MCO6044007.1 hypothetical protein [Aeoliella straminimaris]